MSEIRFAILAASLSLALTACHDTRRETVRDWLQAHPPEGFEVAAIPERINVTDAATGGSEALVTMRYRLAHPTMQVRDGLELPRARESLQRIAAVRGWAIASLPADDSVRKAITAESGKATAALPVKRVVTAAGTETESLVVLSLHEDGPNWKITPEPFAVSVPGGKDEPNVPLEDSAEVAARLDQLESLARTLEETRGRYLAERKRAAELSRSALRSILRAGSAFEGQLADGTPVRLIVAQGVGPDSAVAVVLTVQRAEQSSARYTGALVQQPSGEIVWRAAHVTPLANPGADAVTDVRERPVLALAARGRDLVAEVKTASGTSGGLVFHPAGTVDLIPDESLQVSHEK